MNEVTKLYKNAEVEPINFAKQGAIDFTNTIEIDGKRYPDFTAEKQLEITKLIGSRYGLKFIVNEAMDYMLSTDLFNDNKFNIQGYGYGYDEAIANLINNLWQDLTEEEKQQVKGILE